MTDGNWSSQLHFNSFLFKKPIQTNTHKNEMPRNSHCFPSTLQLPVFLVFLREWKIGARTIRHVKLGKNACKGEVTITLLVDLACGVHRRWLLELKRDFSPSSQFRRSQASTHTHGHKPGQELESFIQYAHLAGVSGFARGLTSFGRSVEGPAALVK